MNKGVLLKGLASDSFEQPQQPAPVPQSEKPQSQEGLPSDYTQNESGLIRPESKNEVVQREKKLVKKEQYLQLKQERDDKLQQLEANTELDTDQKNEEMVVIQTEFATNLADSLDPKPIEGQKTPFAVVQQEISTLGLELPSEFTKAYQNILTQLQELLKSTGVTASTFDDNKDIIIETLKESGFTNLDQTSSIEDLQQVINHNLAFETVVEVYLREHVLGQGNREQVDLRNQEQDLSQGEKVEEEDSKTKEILLQLATDHKGVQEFVERNVDFKTLMSLFLGAETGYSSSRSNGGLEAKEGDQERKTIAALMPVFSDNKVETRFWDKLLDSYDDNLSGGQNLNARINQLFTMQDDNNEQLSVLKDCIFDALEDAYKLLNKTNPIKHSRDLNFSEAVVDYILQEADNFNMQEDDNIIDQQKKAA